MHLIKQLFQPACIAFICEQGFLCCVQTRTATRQHSHCQTFLPTVASLTHRSAAVFRSLIRSVSSMALILIHSVWCHVPHRGTIAWAAANLRLLTFILSPTRHQGSFPCENKRVWPLTPANPSRGQTRLRLNHPAAFMYSLRYSYFIPVIRAQTRSLLCL